MKAYRPSRFVWEDEFEESPVKQAYLKLYIKRALRGLPLFEEDVGEEVPQTEHNASLASSACD